MEWLSHSQKKHCELCKTPFRFTKLYDPNMPPALPSFVFFSHMAKYLFGNLLVWLRAALVASVWLGWLPYLMRSVWSFLFWISDEGLGGRSALFGMLNETMGDGLDLLHGTNVCPSSPLFAATTSVTTIGGVIDNLPPESAKIVKGLYGINLTSSDPIYSTILRLLFGTVGLTDKPTAMASNATSALGKAVSDSPSHQTLLSGVGFLRNLTKHPSINRVVIAVLEGQIITILVIVCFILIILVRDYVVQQQPEINMRAAFAAMDDAPPAPAQEAPEPQADAQGRDEPLEEPFEAASDDGTPFAFNFGGAHGVDIHEEEFPRQDEGFNFAEPLPRPPPAEPRPAMQAPLDTHAPESTTVHEYLAIYREAGGDPETILRIARERGLEDKLDYWIRLTRSMVDSEPSARDEVEPTITPDTLEPFPEVQEGSTASKGKEKLVEEEEEDEDLVAGSSRPRANTDGPKVSDPIHPLANNNWSFTDLPPEPVPEPTQPTVPASLFLDEELYDPPAVWKSNHAEDTSSSDMNPPHHPRPVTPDSSSQGTEGFYVVGADSPSADGNHWAEEAADVPQPQPRAAPQAEALPLIEGPALRPDPDDFVGRVTEFMLRGVDDIAPEDLPPVNLIGDLVHPNDEDPDQQLLNEEMDRDREADVVAAEAIEDAEDLEGILELLGMRGPVAGLFQNAIFCAFLVSITIFVGVFVPYNMGRIAVWTVANPVRLARMMFSLSKFLQDCALVVLGLISSTVSEAAHFLSRAFMLAPVAEYTLGAANASWAMAVSAANRVGGSFMTELPIISTSEMRNFSAVSHEALLAIKDHVASAVSGLWKLFAFLLGGDYSVGGPEALSVAANVSAIAWDGLKELPTVVAKPSSWVLNLSLPEATATFKPELAYWGGADRFWAILAGYVTLSVMAGLYLRRGTLFSTGQAAQEWEASIIDGLNQASGVMKVILIIGIEMLVFPLYCGMLLDIALLPLFENTTLRSRVAFAASYPITSIFVHWFIGTGYMFHFALFVSMCRKIMRKGVLYFIRDPDDPEFHPVRDVLERNVTTQLRKIMFSAFVYGALVLVCLGGVVWGLSLSLPNVLPIHYSSNEPVLEFPVDLLFYNFLMPLTLKFFKASNGLHAMYTWWFRRCARALRITWFLFGERRVDEEGQLVLKSDSPNQNLPVWRRLFLEVGPQGTVVARTWRDIFEGGTAKPTPTIPVDQMLLLNEQKRSLVKSGQLIPDGRFVRTPASDQVKIPKGRNVFLDVDEYNMRHDNMMDTDIYSTNQYQLVYVPPHFRVRVFLFILFIWIFAAVTGVSITIVPLIFGRWMFKLLIPQHIRTNDVYAFSIGIYLLGSAAYALFHARSIYAQLTTAVRSAFPHDAIQRVFDIILRIARVVYAYFFVLIVFPLLVASVVELYALIPLNELMYSLLLTEEGRKSLASGTAKEVNPVHTIRVVQMWTLGLLYLKQSSRLLQTWFMGTRLATAARAVPRRAWLDPDVAILTRAFILPGLAIWTVAVAVPLLVARFAVTYGVAEAAMQASGVSVTDQALRDAYLVLIYRLSYPVTALAITSLVAVWSAVRVFRSWQMRVRDELYLIGERLHNYGQTNVAPRPRRGWRAGRARL